MFLTQKAIEKAFSLLIKLDTQQGRQGKSRKEKVSGLRYLFATSLALKRLPKATRIDLSVGNTESRDDFIKAVGEVVSIDGTSNYTADFAGEFGNKKDFSVGSNFLTTIVARTRGGRRVEYPHRPAPLLDISDEKISIKPAVKKTLDTNYSLNEVKTPLALWLLRTTEFAVKQPKTLLDLVTAISAAINLKFESLVAGALIPTHDEWKSFLDEAGLTIQELFEVSKSSHASLLSKHSSTSYISPAATNIDTIVDSAFNDSRIVGLKLRKSVMQRFIASLLAKRFLILTGLSGSGKTKLAHAFAVWISETEDQYRLVAVGADWTTNENVVGYQDALQAGVYRKPSNGALDVILGAANDPERPYFLILDEMNLSHVERYFADILSAIECGGDIALHSAAEDLKASDEDALLVPSRISLPSNLFIIGTVNVDETTYMFSPKVLDRANVIEFRIDADDIAAFLDAPSKVDLDSMAGNGASFGPAFLAEASAEASLDKATGESVKAWLTEIFGELAPIGAEFGFRTVYEITRFIHFHAKLSGADWQFKDAMDAQVLQKLLPKLHGSERRLGPVLKALEAFCTRYECDNSLKKIHRMQDRLKDGFTSFAEA